MMCTRAQAWYPAEGAEDGDAAGASFVEHVHDVVVAAFEREGLRGLLLGVFRVHVDVRLEQLVHRLCVAAFGRDVQRGVPEPEIQCGKVFKHRKAIGKQ